jgi:hypothetical protein
MLRVRELRIPDLRHADTRGAVAPDREPVPVIAVENVSDARREDHAVRGQRGRRTLGADRPAEADLGPQRILATAVRVRVGRHDGTCGSVEIPLVARRDPGVAIRVDVSRRRQLELAVEDVAAQRVQRHREDGIPDLCIAQAAHGNVRHATDVRIFEANATPLAGDVGSPEALERDLVLRRAVDPVREERPPDDQCIDQRGL